MSDHAALLSFVDQLRTKGVRVYEGPFADTSIKLELGVIEQPMPVGPDTPKQAEKDLCNCKCPIWAHTNGFCLQGCAIESCHPEEK